MGLTTKKLLNVLLIVVISISFSGCVLFIPKDTKPKSYKYKDCKLVFKEKQLASGYVGLPDGCNNEFCITLFGVVIPIGSFVVSGSVVIVNNTLHWIEYNGKCDDGLLKNLIK